MRILVAGVGNIFLGDDGFGVAVAERLSGEQLPPGVLVGDYGIRGVHLAYELLNGYDAVVIVDAVPRGHVPGTLFVLEPEVESSAVGTPVEGHSMSPELVLSLCKELGADVDRVLLVGCEPAHCGEGVGLSEPVQASVDGAVSLVKDVLGQLVDAEGDRR